MQAKICRSNKPWPYMNWTYFNNIQYSYFTFTYKKIQISRVIEYDNYISIFWAETELMFVNFGGKPWPSLSSICYGKMLSQTNTTNPRSKNDTICWCCSSLSRLFSSEWCMIPSQPRENIWKTCLFPK